MKKLFGLLTMLLLLSQYGCEKDCIKNGRCELEPKSGPCLAIYTKYFYDKEEKKCKEFNWGGCEGVIPFETLEECKICECD
ncbi:MAG: BPTI/Kunitz-type proteinase inhibitor domain-containing protein [Saprospiraceae bacterium]|nr:BPTI/Kunitz-type proteinase inhibitor domain-containing protein [Saprospiraceae bacterium]